MRSTANEDTCEALQMKIHASTVVTFIWWL